MQTIVAPTGEPPSIEMKSPKEVQTTENIAEDTVTERISYCSGIFIYGFGTYHTAAYYEILYNR